MDSDINERVTYVLSEVDIKEDVSVITTKDSVKYGNITLGDERSYI